MIASYGNARKLTISLILYTLMWPSTLGYPKFEKVPLYSNNDLILKFSRININTTILYRSYDHQQFVTVARLYVIQDKVIIYIFS